MRAPRTRPIPSLVTTTGQLCPIDGAPSNATDAFNPERERFVCMATLYDVPADALIDALVDRLPESIERPDWATYAKTGAGRELPPEQEEFWRTRAASLLRRVAIDGEIGVDRLTTAYGDTKDGSNRYGVAPPRKTEGSGKIIRTALQQLEAEDLVETAEGEGRRITAEGRSLLDDTAGDVLDDLDRPELERYA
jgi:small subunit ribosomal protein S19e